MHLTHWTHFTPGYLRTGERWDEREMGSGGEGIRSLHRFTVFNSLDIPVWQSHRRWQSSGTFPRLDSVLGSSERGRFHSSVCTEYRREHKHSLSNSERIQNMSDNAAGRLSCPAPATTRLLRTPDLSSNLLWTAPRLSRELREKRGDATAERNVTNPPRCMKVEGNFPEHFTFWKQLHTNSPGVLWHWKTGFSLLCQAHNMT